MSITGITAHTLDMDRITGVMVPTAMVITGADMDRIMGVMAPTAMVITGAEPIMSGGRDIGLGGTANKSGSAGIMCW